MGRPSRPSSPSADSYRISMGFKTGMSIIWHLSARSVRSFLLSELDRFTSRRTCTQSTVPRPVSLDSFTAWVDLPPSMPVGSELSRRLAARLWERPAARLAARDPGLLIVSMVLRAFAAWVFAVSIILRKKPLRFVFSGCLSPPRGSGSSVAGVLTSACWMSLEPACGCEAWLE